MASPKRPQTAYGYSMPSQASPSYPQYPQPSAPFNPQPFDINALFKILGIAPSSTSGSSGVGTGGIGGPIGATPLPLPGKANEPVGTYNPGFLGMPMPISPQAPLPDMSTILPALPPQMPPRGGPVQSLPPMPPRLPEGRPIGGVPPYMPNPMESGYYTNPNQPPSGETVPPRSQYGVPTSSDGKWLFNDGRWMPNNTATTFPMPESRPEEVFPGPGQQTQGKGLDVQKLMDALRAMQGRRQGQGLPTQAPFVPDYMLPINQNTAAIDPNMPISDEQRKRNLEALMGGTPRMPSPSPVPPSQGGRSGMGLGGILNALRASRQR